MTHFRGQIRGPHWGPDMDNMLIDFWRRHECLFNSSVDSYYDKDLKTRLWSEFALSVGKHVCDVERRSRSLRTQYGRVLWHPERVNTTQQKMLRDKLDFLRPYIVRRRIDSYLGDKLEDDRDEDDEEPDIEGTFDHDAGSSPGSPPDVSGRDMNDDARSVASGPHPQLQATEVMTRPAGQPDRDVLRQFAEVMLADMRRIEDPMVLMRLRRDITGAVYEAAEEDVRRRRAAVAPRVRRGPRRPNLAWRPGLWRRTGEGCELGRRVRRREEARRGWRASWGPSSLPVQQGQAPEGAADSQFTVQASEVKIEEEPPLLA